MTINHLAHQQVRDLINFSYRTVGHKPENHTEYSNPINRPTVQTANRESTTNCGGSFINGFVLGTLSTPRSHSTVYINNSHCSPSRYRRDEGDDNSGKRAVAGVAGSIILLGGAYLFGKISGGLNEISDKINDTNEQFNDNTNNLSGEYKKYAKDLKRKTIAVLNEKKQQGKVKLALTITAIALAALLVIGAIANVPMMMIVGGSLLLGAAAAGLGYLGYQLSYRPVDKKIQQVVNCGNIIENNLRQAEGLPPGYVQ